MRTFSTFCSSYSGNRERESESESNTYNKSKHMRAYILCMNRTEKPNLNIKYSLYEQSNV